MCRSWFHFVCCFVLAGHANASTFYAQDFSDTLNFTPTVVRGKVGNVRSDFSKTPDGGQQLYTYTELTVTEVLKGKTEERKILVRELGGQKNGVTMEIPGSVRFRTGEDVVLMLGTGAPAEGAEAFPIQNMSFGKLNVERDADGKEILRGAALNGAPPSGEKSWTLSDVRFLIQNPRPTATKGILFDASAPNGGGPESVGTAENGGKSGLLSDSAKPKTKDEDKSNEGLRDKTGSSGDADSPSDWMLKRVFILIGSLIGVALFLRSYLKKRG